MIKALAGGAARAGGVAALQFHGDHGEHGDHEHEMAAGARGAMLEHIRQLDNVHLTTVGIDIGSSTSHLMFAKVHLRRQANALSSQFVVVNREVLWRSPIGLTPFVDDNTIDIARLRDFFDAAYAEAGYDAAGVDSGAVILTGEAIRRSNARAIADLFAAQSGRFVCASAGHHLECVLAAHGSGAVSLSRMEGRALLHVDIGGGTTKFALVRKGEVLGTCAIAVGGRLLAMDADGRLVRADTSALALARGLGLGFDLGRVPDPVAVDTLVQALASAVITKLQGGMLEERLRHLYLTEPLLHGGSIDCITFSGGVSEYLHGREKATFGDIALPLARALLRGFADGRVDVPLRDPGQGIRATVIGASQFTVQVSGRTTYISDEGLLPLHNVPVIAPALDLDDRVVQADVAARVGAALALATLHEGDPLALAFRWSGDPDYFRLHALAAGIRDAVRDGAPGCACLVLLVDGDIGETLGHLMQHELHFAPALLSMDGLQLQALDYVDIGEVLRPSSVVPIVIKSLLFANGQRSLSKPA